MNIHLKISLSILILFVISNRIQCQNKKTELIPDEYKFSGIITMTLDKNYPVNNGKGHYNRDEEGKRGTIKVYGDKSYELNFGLGDPDLSDKIVKIEKKEENNFGWTRNITVYTGTKSQLKIYEGVKEYDMVTYSIILSIDKDKTLNMWSRFYEFTTFKK
jgi:hypothetical protein